MKRFLAAAAAFPLFFLTCCGPALPQGGGEDERDEQVEISLWTYPIGGWENHTTVGTLLTSFHNQYPNIRVSVKFLGYNTGDAEIDRAAGSNALPDLVLEGPERLVANWGVRGLMTDLNDLWAEEGAQKIYGNVKAACHDVNGDYYVYPLCMTTHCMAINRDLFEEADAWQYVDETTHTWTTENFLKAVEALRAHGVENVAAIYCGGQGGDQGTRALVNNLYGGKFTNSSHTGYAVNSEENIRALQVLKDTQGIDFDPEIVGSDEIVKFCNGELAMAFCWNVSMEINYTVSDSIRFDVFPMAFPTNEGDPQLQGGIWGFGIFDNGDAKRTEAAKTFIRYMTTEDRVYTRAVRASTYWPVRDLQGVYVNDALMSEYEIFRPYLGDYYQVTPGWTEARTAWWNMLQKIGAGNDVAQTVSEYFG